VVGVPGYRFQLLVPANHRAALAKFLGQGPVTRPKARAVVLKIASHLGSKNSSELPGSCRKQTRCGAVGAALGLTTMVQADGLMRIPSLSEGC
jgi:hypothetical protein